MTDRDCEMVKNAALAAGYRWRGFSGYQPLLEEDPSKPEPRLACPHNWNPLTDDGDALRLAVALNFTVTAQPSFSHVSGLYTPDGFEINETSAPCEECGGDLAAATRRAITRAAAAIQEAKEGV